MELYIDKRSHIPAVRQIQEQIKLAVAMGILRSGDALPSIRDIANQTGINRGQIHRAYLALKQFGLLVPNRGKGTVITAAAVSSHSMNERCQQLGLNIISKVRQLGVSPTAFVRYLSRQVQDAERSAPFISYVEHKKEVAVQRAAEVSQLWQVPVIGLTVLELRSAVRKGSKLPKVLANHLVRDKIRSLLPSKKIDVIPIGVRYTEQTSKELAQIRSNSSVLRILPAEFFRNSRFIIAQLQKLIRSPGVKISSLSLRDVSFGKPLNGSKYDYILVDPGILSEVPRSLLRSPRTLLVRMQLDPTSLEAARIRAGVII